MGLEIHTTNMNNVIIFLSCVATIHAYCQDASGYLVQSEFYDLFNTSRCEWKLAFRGTAGTKTSVLQAYTEPQNNTYIEGGCRLPFLDIWPCTQHYRTGVLDHWHWVAEVALVAIKDSDVGGKMVAYVVFDAKDTGFSVTGQSTDPQHWMTQDRVISSSWSDISNSSANFFSIQGDTALHRHFYMNHVYGTAMTSPDGDCPGDYGWFAAVDKRRAVPCRWEKAQRFPVFVYSTRSTMADFNNPQHVDTADTMAVFVKYGSSLVG